MRILLLALLWLILVPTPASASLLDWPTVTVNGTPGVVMPQDVAEDVIWSGDDITGYWLPDESWLEQVEEILVEWADTYDDSRRAPILDGYRQYGGYIENGDRKIFINSFCREFDGWRRGHVRVMDGGACFWNAVYNVDTGEMEKLYVNGVA